MPRDEWIRADRAGCSKSNFRQWLMPSRAGVALGGPQGTRAPRRGLVVAIGLREEPWGSSVRSADGRLVRPLRGDGATTAAALAHRASRSGEQLHPARRRRADRRVKLQERVERFVDAFRPRPRSIRRNHARLGLSALVVASSMSGVQRSAPRSKRSFWIRDSATSNSASAWSRATPSMALSSSTVP